MALAHEATIDVAPAPASPRRSRPRKRGAGSGQLPGSRIGYVYVLPFFLVFAAFSVYPWLDTAWVSLHDVRLSTYHQQTWIGLDNYRDLFTNPYFWNATPSPSA
jgi:cellobiose transport system permease protein